MYKIFIDGVEYHPASKVTFFWPTDGGDELGDREIHLDWGRTFLTEGGQIAPRGWQCPVCGKVNAPFAPQCPCRP